MKSKKLYKFNPDYAVPPGATLQEHIEFMGISQKELAKVIGLSEYNVNKIIDGTTPVTHDIATRLNKATNVPVHMWENLEKNYREHF